jgi:hypothetical protein
MGHTQPPIQWVLGGSFLGIELLVGCEDDHSPPSLAKDETLLRYNFTLL